MSSYQTPTITELGSVADFTQADHLAFAFDGFLFHGGNSGPGNQTS